jgi:2,3-bisphosphoglycerate-dependent phosphoglycerate mutase
MSLPERLWLVRHGESVANVARHKAEAEDLTAIDFPYRESDVPLSETGKQQARTVGRWIATLEEDDRPRSIYSSTFLRTTESAALLLQAGGLKIPVIADERLRERELGIFDRLTKLGVTQKYPDECARREFQGKYYYRPPGGENWCDVILRARSFWDDLTEENAEKSVLIITHEVVIRCLRCVIESLSEQEIMAIDAASDFKNGALAEYRLDGTSDKLQLVSDNFLPEI